MNKGFGHALKSSHTILVTVNLRFKTYNSRPLPVDKACILMAGKPVNISVQIISPSNLFDTNHIL